MTIKKGYKKHALCVYDNGVICLVHEVEDPDMGVNEKELHDLLNHRLPREMECLKTCKRDWPAFVKLYYFLTIEKEKEFEKNCPNLIHINCRGDIESYFLPF